MKYRISAVITYGASGIIEAENQMAADRIARESTPEDFDDVDEKGVVTRTVVTVVVDPTNEPETNPEEGEEGEALA